MATTIAGGGRALATAALRALRRCGREPLVHFAILGTAVFAL